MYLKNCKNKVFLTQFNPLATDIDGKPIDCSMRMAYIISKSSKIYNYYTKEEIMLDTLFRKYAIPKDYHYYYEDIDKRYQHNKKVLNSFGRKKRGIKLWLISN